MTMAGRSRASGIGGRLSEARKDAGLTLRGLADRAGIGHVTIDSIEKDRNTPGTEVVERLADALNVSPCWLAYGIGPKQSAEGDVDAGNHVAGSER